MIELKNTLLILKTRWKELAILLGFNIFFILPAIFSQPGKSHPKMLMDLLIVFSLLFIIFILWTCLFLGFLRTIATDPWKCQSPITLLKIGKHFFWRFLGFLIIFGIAFSVVMWVIFFVAKIFIPINAGFLESARTMPWLYQSCYTITVLIFIKPLLFTLPLIIVQDCKILRSLKLLKYCKLFEVKELLLIFAVLLTSTWLWVFFPIPYRHIVLSIIRSLITTIMSIMAVRFVTSLNLPYDTELSRLNSQGLLKPE